jgi:hypothetical protein
VTPKKEHAGDAPQPIRGELGASILGPVNVELERQNPDLLASPYTDHGTLPNLKFSFSVARNRLLIGGWAREVTVRELPIATQIAGAGDVGYIPFAMGHYVENTGEETLRFLEMFRSDQFADLSLNQWMALTPPELVQAHLNLDEKTMTALRKDKPVIVMGDAPRI